MDLWLRLAIALVVFLIGVAVIIWGHKLSAFEGVWGVLEDLLPRTLRTILRRVVNTCFGLILIIVAAMILFLGGNNSSQTADGSSSRGSSSGSAKSAPADARP